MPEKDIYEKLGEHLSTLGMGYPYRDDLIDILKENFTPMEAEAALAIPTGGIPLQPVSMAEIIRSSTLPGEELVEALENLAERRLIFTGKTEDGETGYALHHVGYGFPQTFFWEGEETPHSKKMARLVAKYFNRKVTQEAYGTETKPYRYIPVNQTIEFDKQAVLPLHVMESIIEQAEVIAVGHCPCRVAYKLCGKGCEHSTEVCMKYNDMARYVIDRGLAREITKDEAMELIKVSEKEGLVHFVDNVEGEIQHNCNCCGCACWNVGSIRRRKIPRDKLMAVYFIRKTEEEACSGCGECIERCPVDAVKMGDVFPVVDEEWCIGCGVCATTCPGNAIEMRLRPDRTGQLPARSFRELQEKIREEK